MGNCSKILLLNQGSQQIHITQQHNIPKQLHPHFLHFFFHPISCSFAISTSDTTPSPISTQFSSSFIEFSLIMQNWLISTQTHFHFHTRIPFSRQLSITFHIPCNKNHTHREGMKECTYGVRRSLRKGRPSVEML